MDVETALEKVRSARGRQYHIMLEGIMTNVQDDLEIQKMKLHYNFAKFAMWGTLFGLLGVLIIMLVIVIAGIATEPILDGWHIVTIFTVSIGCALGFGAFIWGRSIKIGNRLQIGLGSTVAIGLTILPNSIPDSTEVGQNETLR